MLFTNLWYVAESSANVGAEPRHVRMLGRDFVLYRTPEGRAACLSDVCVHRGARLARGKCHEDGTVACPFHGWRFDADGQCTRIPSLENPTAGIPPGARVDAYPTQEKFGLVWVFLGDDIESAVPVFDMPEYQSAEWRGVTFTDTWDCNVHWSKMTDLDHVHLSIVHGLDFGGENPVRPPDHQVETTSNGFRTMIESKPTVLKGKWQEMRGQRTPVTSRLAFMIPGFTLRGQIEIGGTGSGFYNVFYEMSTPIDEETTRLHWYFFRSFMLEPANDAEHLKRNLRNIFQDKANAESFLPRRAPDVPVWPKVTADREDKVMTAYWQTMQDMRRRGWQIDRLGLDALDRNGDYRVIPSPARRERPEGWVFESVPRIPADAALAAAAGKLSA